MLLNNKYNFNFLNENIEDIKDNHNKNNLLNILKKADDYLDKYFTDNKDGVLTPEECKRKERLILSTSILIISMQKGLKMLLILISAKPSLKFSVAKTRY